jgi:peptide deformylase
MEIVRYPHPALRWKSKPVRRIDAAFRAQVEEMFDLMYAERGIGLAANQVALPLRVFVANPTGDPAEKEYEQVFINPEIVSKKGSALGEEGCLSLPDLYGPVNRAERITVVAFDLSGQEFEMDLDDLPSRVIQHENDHLDGVLFIDRLPEADRRQAEQFLTAFEDEFRRRQRDGVYPPDDQIEAELRRIESVEG